MLEQDVNHSRGSEEPCSSSVPGKDMQLKQLYLYGFKVLHVTNVWPCAYN